MDWRTRGPQGGLKNQGPQGGLENQGTTRWIDEPGAKCGLENQGSTSLILLPVQIFYNWICAFAVCKPLIYTTRQVEGSLTCRAL